MASVATALRSSNTVRKPAAAEQERNPSQPSPVRQAFGSDIVGSGLSPRAQLGYRVLVDHINRGRDPLRPYDGEVFLTDETFAAELGGVSKRQAQRIRSELLAGGWICLPKGDGGGRGNSTVRYHLHPDGRRCPLAQRTLLKQRSAAPAANLRRAEARERHKCDAAKDDQPVVLSTQPAPKDDNRVVLSTGAGQGNDDACVIVFCERMTETATKDDRKDGKDDKSDAAYKEELFQELIPEPSSTTTAAVQGFPPEFSQLMDEELPLDDGALRRLWQEARSIVSDSTAEEVRYFFHERAVVVYRNRRLNNPTGVMLSTVHDWFPRRRVLARREVVRRLATEEMTTD